MGDVVYWYHNICEVLTEDYAHGERLAIKVHNLSYDDSSGGAISELWLVDAP